MSSGNVRTDHVIQHQFLETPQSLGMLITSVFPANDLGPGTNPNPAAIRIVPRVGFGYLQQSGDIILHTDFAPGGAITVYKSRDGDTPPSKSQQEISDVVRNAFIGHAVGSLF